MERAVANWRKGHRPDAKGRRQLAIRAPIHDGLCATHWRTARPDSIILCLSSGRSRSASRRRSFARLARRRSSVVSARTRSGDRATCRHQHWRAQRARTVHSSAPRRNERERERCAHVDALASSFRRLSSCESGHCAPKKAVDSVARAHRICKHGPRADHSAIGCRRKFV